MDTTAMLSRSITQIMSIVKDYLTPINQSSLHEREHQLHMVLQQIGQILLQTAFEQRIQRPRDHTEADTDYSGKKKTHTLKNQVAVDETTSMIVAISASVRGPTADITVLQESGVLTRLPSGVGAIGDLAYIGIDRLHPTGLGAAPAANRVGSPAHPMISRRTPRFPVGGFSWNIPSVVYAGLPPWLSPTVIIDSTIPVASAPSRVSSIVAFHTSLRRKCPVPLGICAFLLFVNIIYCLDKLGHYSFHLLRQRVLPAA